MKYKLIAGNHVSIPTEKELQRIPTTKDNDLTLAAIKIAIQLGLTDIKTLMSSAHLFASIQTLIQDKTGIQDMEALSEILRRSSMAAKGDFKELGLSINDYIGLPGGIGIKEDHYALYNNQLVSLFEDLTKLVNDPLPMHKKVTKGVLLSSEPGIGKSKFIVWFATQMQNKALYVRISDAFFENVEDRVSTLMRVYKECEQLGEITGKKVLLVIENLDILTPHKFKELSVERSSHISNKTMTSSTDIIRDGGDKLATALTSTLEDILDGSGPFQLKNVITFATTNNLGAIDEALFRDGRLRLEGLTATGTPEGYRQNSEDFNIEALPQMLKVMQANMLFLIDDFANISTEIKNTFSQIINETKKLLENVPIRLNPSHGGMYNTHKLREDFANFSHEIGLSIHQYSENTSLQTASNIFKRTERLLSHILANVNNINWNIDDSQLFISLFFFGNPLKFNKNSLNLPENHDPRLHKIPVSEKLIERGVIDDKGRITSLGVETFGHKEQLKENAELEDFSDHFDKTCPNILKPQIINLLIYLAKNQKTLDNWGITYQELLDDKKLFPDSHYSL